jgi:hypothetical protein
VPETSTDLVKALCRRWRGEFAKRPDMPSMSGGPRSRSGPSSPPNPRRAVLAIGSASSWAALGPPRNLVSRVRFRPVLFVFLT